MRAVYGLHGQEMVSWITHLQHAIFKNIWFVGVLDEKLDEFNRKIFSIQLDGNKAANELPAIVDQIITMCEFTTNGKSKRCFINHTINPYGYPAKDRSGALDMIEEADLGKLMKKIESKILSKSKSEPTISKNESNNQKNNNNNNEV